jgi:hypothetical protein
MKIGAAALLTGTDQGDDFGNRNVIIFAAKMGKWRAAQHEVRRLEF